MKILKHKIIFILLISFFILAGLFALFYSPSEKVAVLNNQAKNNNQKINVGGFLYSLKINNVDLYVELADTPEKRVQGLSGRKELKNDRGMLFVFDKPNTYSFWMKDMNFPIDIIWIGEDLKITDITHNAKPESYPKIFQPKKPAKYVIEVNSGWNFKNGIQIGMIVPLGMVSKSFEPIVISNNQNSSADNAQGQKPLTNIDFKGALLSVPFTPQAPFANWSDPRFEDGCEEASAIMAMAWANSETMTPQYVNEEIISISDYEVKNYGGYQDTSAADTALRIFKGYFHYGNVEARSNINNSDIKAELAKGNLVVVPMNGQKLKNPFYNPPGPVEHMVVVVGYDETTKEFITNDPGTKHGEGYRYKEDIFEKAMQDYPTGNHLPITEIKTAMIVIEK